MKTGRNGGLIVEKIDQCAKCSFWNPDNRCALIQFLAEQGVCLAQPQIIVENCIQFDPLEIDDDAPSLKRIK